MSVFRVVAGLFFLFALQIRSGATLVFTRGVKTEARGYNKMECKTHISQMNYDTTIIITSSLIPTHPSIAMINCTYHSLKMLHGLQNGSPVYVTVDGLDPSKNDNEEKKKRLQEYVRNLRHTFKNNDRVKFLTSYTFGHLTNSLKMTIDLVDTQYCLCRAA